MKICAVMTSHNRREATLAAIDSVLASEVPEDVKLEVFVLDDGSSDGTAAAIASQYPQVHVVSGSGSLYWGGGMRGAIAAASRGDPDFYLWINDDVTIRTDAVMRVLGAAEQLSTPDNGIPVIVGPVVDPASGSLAYGGVLRRRSWHPLRYEKAPLASSPCRVDTFNGNFVLIPRSIAEEVGPIDPSLSHALGDYDYGLRVSAHGFAIWVVSGSVGSCVPNPGPSLPGGVGGARERLRWLFSPKGVPPRAWLAYTRRHAGVLWPIYWLGTYAKALFTGPSQR